MWRKKIAIIFFLGWLAIFSLISIHTYWEKEGEYKLEHSEGSPCEVCTWSFYDTHVLPFSYSSSDTIRPFLSVYTALEVFIPIYPLSELNHSFCFRGPPCRGLV